jgi:hypothetical protein
VKPRVPRLQVRVPGALLKRAPKTSRVGCNARRGADVPETGVVKEEPERQNFRNKLESLILAQSERWRRA